MPLLRLPVLKATDEAVLQSCEGKDHCSKCELFGKFCKGVTEDKKKEICGEQMQCETDCNACHGEDTARLVSGVCCKSPVAPWAIAQIKKLDTLVYPRAERLEFPDERIPILLDRHHDSPAPVNAIGIHRVYSSKGWKSADIKDYLQLPKKSKLVLLTVMRDNHLDNMLDRPWYETVNQVGFDYWMPLLFSMFQNESLMQRLFSFYRIMQNVVDAKAHVLPFPQMSGHNRLLLDPYMERAVKRIPNIFLNISHGSEQGDFTMKILGYLKKYSQIYGGNVTWLFQGATIKAKRKMLRSLLPQGSSCYFFITPKTGARRSGDQYGWHDDE